MDQVDQILAQWHRERPDLDVTPMGLIGRLMRIANFLSREMEKTFTEHGLNGASFDLLATLRRSGPPYRLLPGDLMSMMMITSGTMTNRIDRLVQSGLVERQQNPEDGRSVFIALTDRGYDVIEAAVGAHVRNQARIVSMLPEAERQSLNALLSLYLEKIEAGSSR